MTPLLLIALSLPVQAADTVYAVDLYGLRSVPEASVRAAIGLRAGDRLPASVEPIGARVKALPGVAEVGISRTCCSENGRTILYLGIREVGTPALTFRPAPTGAISLPPEILAVQERADSALVSAVRRGVASEDRSQGYSLAQDSALRAVQLEFVRIAAERLDTLISVLHRSREAGHRAIAAEVIAYARDRRVAVRELLYAARDPGDEVRNNAVRALAVMAEWANQNPQAGIVIPAEPFVEYINSVSWTDRNKGVMVLIPLTQARAPAVLDQLRARGLASLIEMARWSNTGHALGPYVILARLAGVDDAEAFRAWQNGEREAIIARVKGR